MSLYLQNDSKFSIFIKSINKLCIRYLFILFSTMFKINSDQDKTICKIILNLLKNFRVIDWLLRQG